MGNMNEVPPNDDVPSNKTMDIKDSEVIKIKTSSHEKKHHTVVSACSASGKNCLHVNISEKNEAQ